MITKGEELWLKSVLQEFGSSIPRDTDLISNAAGEIRRIKEVLGRVIQIMVKAL